MKQARGRRRSDRSLDDIEPTTAELAAITREWPLIAAELTVINAEVAIANADGRPSELDGYRLDRAEQLVRDAAADQRSRRRPRRRRSA